MKPSLLGLLGTRVIDAWRRSSNRTAILLILLFSGVLSTISLTRMNRALFNDEAYELMITEGVPLDRFYFMSPAHAYPHGSVAPIEMGPLYLHRFLFWLFGDTLLTRADYLTPIYISSAVMLALACVAFFYSFRRYVSRLEAMLAALLLAASYTALVFNQFVTRNTFTLIWGTLLMIVVPWFLSAAEKPPARNLKTAFLCALIVLAGAWTFTTYLLVAVAVWGALLLDWLRFDRRWTSLGWMVLSGAGFGVTFLGLLLFDTFTFQDVLLRGGYAINGVDHYLKNAAWSILSPIIYKAYGDFFIEDVHIIFGRAAFSGGLIPCFAVGLMVALRSRKRPVFLAVTTWLIGMMLCALSGPNPKYLYTFFPLTLLIALLGAKTIHEWLRNRLGMRSAGGVVALLLLSSVVLDLYGVSKQPLDRNRNDMNALPQMVAEHSMAAVESGADTYVQIGSGYDILNWYLWPAGVGNRVYRCPVAAGLPDMLATHPPHAGSVLFVDYPPESLKETLPNWTMPAEVTVKMVERGGGD